MNSLRAIVKGCLEFGNLKSYQMMTAQFQKRLETYYKNDIMFKTPEFFNDERMSIDIPRTQVLCTEKTWKNSIAMWRELRSFAVAGELHMWILDENNGMVHAETIVPQGDKVATTEYLRGVEMLKKGGNEDKAKECFERALEKYENYWQAYERRGQANLVLGRYEDALLDFSKSINLYKNPYGYLGLGRTQFELGNFEQAVHYFQLAIDNAVPYQPVFWTARRIKGEAHVLQNEVEKALFELKLVTKRAFKESDPNYKYRRHSWKMYGEALMKAGQSKDACAAFREALSIEQCPTIEEMLQTAAMLPTSPAPRAGATASGSKSGGRAKKSQAMVAHA